MRVDTYDRLAVLGAAAPSTIQLPYNIPSVLTGGGAPSATYPSVIPSGYTDWAKQVANIQSLPPSQQTGQLLMIAAAALPIPVVGQIIAGISAGLAFLGITIRGKTQHVDAATAGQKAGEFMRAYLVPLYNGLPADAKAKFKELMYNWDLDMYGRFATWWGGRIAGDRQGHASQLTDWTSIADFAAYLVNPYSIPFNYFYNIVHEADADSVNENLKTWFMDNLANDVLKPLDGYMLQKYNQTVEQYEAAGGSGATKGTQAGSTLASVGWIGLALGALAALPKMISRS